MDFFALLDELDRLVGESPSVPLVNLALVPEQALIALLARLRATLPEEAQAAHRLREERRSIVRRAEAEADTLVAQAHAEVDRLVHDAHLLRDARARADEVLREAQAKAEMVRTGADALVAATLESFSRQLADLETVLARDMIALREGVQTLDERVSTARGRGELPLRPEEELVPPRPGIQQEYRLDPRLTGPNPRPGAGPNTPAPDSPIA